jgi:hypothetical protein
VPLHGNESCHYTKLYDYKEQKKKEQDNTEHLSLLYTGTYAKTGGENANSNMGKTFFQGRFHV